MASEDIEAQTLSGQTTVINTAVSDVGRETTSSGAGHTGGELDDDEIEGIERLQTAFEELKSHITKAWNDAMVMVVDELAFTKINTLMTVAREAADRVIETSARFVREPRQRRLTTWTHKGIRPNNVWHRYTCWKKTRTGWYATITKITTQKGSQRKPRNSIETKTRSPG